MTFSLKCIAHEDNKSFFPKNPNIGNMTEVREREEFARTKQYQQSAIPACQRLVNNHFRERSTASGPAGAAAGEGAGARPGAGEEAGARAG